MAEATEATAYDAVTYPTALFPQTAPDRMATLAVLAGLDPPGIATARVLEIAAGDGMNLTALAAAWPEARFVGFDLAPSAITRGNDVIAAAGLTNIRLEVLDVLDVGDRLDGAFDYIIAHGLYAWVPADVRAATMALIGRLLSPRGLAFVSYNAMPGGYIRMALRDALLFAVADAQGVEDRIDTAYRNLELLAQPSESETAAQAALRLAAEATMRQARPVVFHDELGAHYNPQSLSDVVAAARGVGLRFLGDAALGMLHHAFLSDEWAIGDDPEAQVLQLRQAEDYRAVRFFRSTLLVRDALRPSRRLDLAAMDRLYAACDCERTDANTFENAHGQFEIDDDDLLAILGRLIDVAPARVSISDLDLDVGEAQRMALFQLYDAGYVQLHTTPEPYATTPGDRPLAGPLARVVAAAEGKTVPTLDHFLLPLDPAETTLLPLLDGTRDRAALADAAAGIDIGATLETLARKGMLLA